MYLWFADLVLVTHMAIVVFVAAMLPLILFGYYKNWLWVRGYWLRILHLATIAIVVAQSWLGIVCPLTTLEMWLRERGGGESYNGSFIEHWLQQVLYWGAAPWVFVMLYSVFALLVIGSWVFVPPERPSKQSHS